MPRSKPFFTNEFSEIYDKLDKQLKDRVDKVISKILEKPQLGKPLSFGYAGKRNERIGPFRLIYEIKGDIVILLTFEHRKKVYRR